MLTLYNVISTDGYITERDSSEDFIPDGVFDDFIDLCKKNSAIVMGRKTYDAMQKYDKKLLDKFENLSVKKIIVSKNTSFIPKEGYIRASSPEDAIALEPQTLVSSGPTLNSYFLRNGLIDRIVFNTLSNKNIGHGIRPFDIDTKSFLGEPISEEIKEGRKLITYGVINAYLV